MLCKTESQKKGVLQADLKRNISVCFYNSFCRNLEQKEKVDPLPCCKKRPFEKEIWDTARNSVEAFEALQKVLEVSEMGALDFETKNESWRTRGEDRNGKKWKTQPSLCVET